MDSIDFCWSFICHRRYHHYTVHLFLITLGEPRIKYTLLGGGDDRPRHEPLSPWGAGVVSYNSIISACGKSGSEKAVPGWSSLELGRGFVRGFWFLRIKPKKFISEWIPISLANSIDQNLLLIEFATIFDQWTIFWSIDQTMATIKVHSAMARRIVAPWGCTASRLGWWLLRHTESLKSFEGSFLGHDTTKKHFYTRKHLMEENSPLFPRNGGKIYSKPL